MLNCRVEANALQGLRAEAASYVDGSELTISSNGKAGIVAQHSQMFCLGCRLEANATFAAASAQSAYLALEESVVSGKNGLFALDGGHVDIDCFSYETSYPCSLTVTQRAVFAVGTGDATLFGVGSFEGSLVAGGTGYVLLYGARQRQADGPMNLVSEFATLEAVGVDPAAGISELANPTEVMGFGRLLLDSGSVLSGPLTCEGGGDAYLEPGVTVAPGQVTGCVHIP